MNYLYQLATHEDDNALRQFINSIIMPGKISLKFTRQPNYFSSLKVEGNSSKTLIVKDEKGDITGCGNISEKLAYLNNEIISIGYLSGLRVAPEHRSMNYLSRAYNELYKLHKIGNAKLYLSTIVSDNSRATKVLEKGLSRLPKYHKYGVYNTYLIPFKKISFKGNITISSAQENDLEELFLFLNNNCNHYQFFPKYVLNDLQNGLLKGININEIYIARQNNSICGCMALWNQQTYKQIQVHSYSFPIRFLRPLINLTSFIHHEPQLPPPNREFPTLKIALPLAKNNDANILLALLNHCQKEAQRQRLPLFYGLHENDTFNPYLKKLCRKKYETNLYLVYWQDGCDSFRKLNLDHPPYIELGSL